MEKDEEEEEEEEEEEGVKRRNCGDLERIILHSASAPPFLDTLKARYHQNGYRFQRNGSCVGSGAVNQTLPRRYRTNHGDDNITAAQI
ncbi:hypothetical protein Pcinc_044351 [Petrolisthes cinctipes]|uniref:Uncharacterized protein n=1 Tax=Petrolisthes cinctipes TaxID=88211 RepID=A0AAE1EEE5_PETCI|nr:hypothetical protein Pcinc_044351 [Petrolisthes cinctipes]